MNDYWSRYRQSMTDALHGLQVTSADGKNLTAEQSLQMLCDWTKEVRERGGMLHFAGNGASACMASHMAVDWTKNAGVKALAYNDVAFLTAIGNDLGYENVFARPVQWFGRQGDLLATISSSGNSPNVLKAIEAARAGQMQVVTFSGMKPDNKSRRSGDLNFYIPANTYGMVECSHQILLHAWLDQFMNVREWEMKLRDKNLL
jgi:D-sedoheptulose 7-phosphate isomerase